MSTKRTDILNYIKTILEGVSDLQEVFVNKSTIVDIETVKMPCAFVFSGPESRLVDPHYSVIGYETWDWNVGLEVWAQDTDMEALLGSIHEKMHSGEQMNGKAVTSFRTGVNMMVIDPTQSLEVMAIDYSIIYRHVKGGPGGG